eukprot:CAMPEP_0204636970 /NCGR_PEP_ID=MMETSP0717-20131115/35366_1 /ASSEMBLY_ACC=CAM_ASM_000666 /TAXON_ID=230516 /ORGANISM="Chaetoceros curvisetus" /LENGTH=195 /DNA_ID=CAMNT_0051656215 /DNA_START=40 /DNA_END=627 /DNA_ORIENTATION=+
MPPRIKIPAHVFGYSLATIPGVAYAIYWKQNHKSDEDLEKILLENQANKALIEGSRDKKQNMVKFFEGMKDGDMKQESKMREVLYGGKGDMKRHYRVDETLYGTEEGARLAKEAQAQAEGKGEQQVATQESGEKRKKRRKKGKRKKKKKAVDDNENTDATADTSQQQRHVIATGAAAGTIALAALIFLGGGKRSQ